MEARKAKSPYSQVGGRELTGNGMSLEISKFTPSGTSSNKNTPPNPFQIVPATGDQGFKHMSLEQPFSFKPPLPASCSLHHV